MIWSIAAIAFLLQDLDAYRWKSRVLLQFGEQPRLSAQTEAAFKERDLVVLAVDTPQHRKHFKVKSPFAWILIGKDGGEKARWPSSVDPQVILKLIDSMPMRQAEIRRQN